MNPTIRFFSEEVDFVLKGRIKRGKWIADVIRTESKRPGSINIIFCSDIYLSELNKAYLDHTTLTDIITFPFTEESDKISGDIFISIERIRENAARFLQSAEDELNRVMVHGVLHLLGYKDKSKNDKSLMTAKEDYYLLKLKLNVSRGTCQIIRNTILLL